MNKSNLKSIILIAVVLSLMVISLNFRSGLKKQNISSQINSSVAPEQERASLNVNKDSSLQTLEKYLRSPKTKRSKQKLSLVTYQADKVFPGQILLPMNGTAEVLLVDHQLNILHSWPLDTARARLTPDCKLGVIFGTKSGEGKSPWKDILNLFAEFDWNSNILWSYQAPNTLHHDFQYLKNDQLLFLQHRHISQKFRDKELQDYSRWDKIVADYVYQLDRQHHKHNEWKTWESFDINSCGQRPNCVFENEGGKRKRKIRNQDWTHSNSVSLLPKNQWYNQGHTEFRPGNLLILARNLWQAFIVDQDSKEVVWTYSGTDNDPLITGHEVQMIDQGVPGAGNIMIFDNGSNQRPYSIIREINPVTKETVWSYQNPDDFFSPTGGSMQRLPNGNTFVSADNGGNIFEVTADREVVWQMKSNFRVYRAHKYQMDQCLQ